MDQTHKQPLDWWEKQLTPLALEFARESVSLSDQEYEEITGQILEGCKPSPCAYKLAEAVIEIISRKRTEVRSRSGGGGEKQMGDVSTFKDWLETAKDKIEAAEAVGFTRAEAIELVKIFEIWGLNDSIGCVRF